MSDRTHAFDNTVAEYVQLRDKVKAAEEEFKRRMAPHKQRLTELENEMLNYLNQNELQNVKTRKWGTVYRKDKTNASVADWARFLDFIIENDAFDMLERRCNTSQVVEHMKEEGPVPGVNVSTYSTVGVRKG